MRGNFKLIESRCLYENDAILVAHDIMEFADRSKEAVMIYFEKKDRLLFKVETGPTQLPVSQLIILKT